MQGQLQILTFQRKYEDAKKNNFKFCPDSKD